MWVFGNFKKVYYKMTYTVTFHYIIVAKFGNVYVSQLITTNLIYYIN